MTEDFVTFDLNVSLIVEIVLAMLLTATLVYCALLECRLRLLRGDQAELSKTVVALNSGIARAQTSLGALRAAAAEAGEVLDAKAGAARALADELSVLTAAGERIASRIEAARPAPASGPRPQAQPSRTPPLSEKLRALR